MSYKPFSSLQIVAESAISNKPVSRRDVLIGGIEGMASIGLLYLFGACAPEGPISFRDAQENYKLRQKYVNQTVEENPPPAELESITYRHDIRYSPNPLFPMEVWQCGQDLQYQLGGLARNL